MPIKVLLVDDHQILREGLRILIERECDFVVTEAENGLHAIKLARIESPDVIVTDLMMPVLNGVDAIRSLRLISPHAKIIALSAQSIGPLPAMALNAGAAAYLSKTVAYKDLIVAIRAAIAGKPFPSSGDGENALPDAIAEKAVGAAQISPRERQVLQLLTEGQTTKQVALTLSISVKTVETHRSQIMEKLGLYNLAELTKFALRENITFNDH